MRHDTRRWRYRTGFKGVLILQVEETVDLDPGPTYEETIGMAGRPAHMRYRRRWRDARVTDSPPIPTEGGTDDGEE